MKIKEKGHTIFIKKSNGSIYDLVDKIESQYNTFKNHNLIIDLINETELDMDFLKSFDRLSELQIENKKSFVIVTPLADFNNIDEALMVVPSLQEAQDIIEMEEIERDLGF